MPLKKPAQIFSTEVEPTISVSSDTDGDFSRIKEELGKVDNLRDQLNKVSSSLNNSLTEVVDKNLNDYTDQLDKFNDKIDSFKEEINDQVDSVKKSNQDIRAEITIVEQRQNKFSLNAIKEEVLSDVQNILEGDIADNFKKLEGKIDIIRDSYQQTLSEGLLDEPPNSGNGDPLSNQNFVTLDELNKHYKLFLSRIQQQLSTIGGGGELNDDGWEYVSDSGLESSPITLASDTWTQLTNDGGSGSTNRSNLPRESGVTAIYNTTVNKIDLSQCENRAHVIFRFGVKANPTVDNTNLKCRLYWTTSSGSNYEVEAPGALLNDGAGQVYEEQFTIPFYVGYDSTRNGYGIVQIKADGECEITDSAFLTIVG